MLRPAILIPTMLLALAWVATAEAHSSGAPAASAVAITRSGNRTLGGPFSLIDQSGRQVSDRDFRGAPMLIYFGYTNCKDACPLDAQAIAAAIDLLDARGFKVTPIFITVDPARDSPARLREFLAAFHPRFVGLTGPVEDVGKVAAAYGAEDDPVNVKAPDAYDVLHPAIAYLMGAEGEFIDLIPLGDPPGLIAKRITGLVRKPG